MEANPSVSLFEQGRGVGHLRWRWRWRWWLLSELVMYDGSQPLCLTFQVREGFWTIEVEMEVVVVERVGRVVVVWW